MRFFIGLHTKPINNAKLNFLVETLLSIDELNKVENKNT